MPRTKTFDCVRMKEEIQAELLERHQGMTEEEIREDEEKRIKASPILEPIYEDLTRAAKKSNPSDSN